MTPTEIVPAGVDQEAILRHLNLNPRDVNTQALLLICHRYGLDPLLKHVVLIQGRPYITRDGYLAVAHASQQLDGIEVLDEGEDETHWWAKVAVHRKDMGRPFSYRGRYPKIGSGNKEYGPEMAVKCSEVASLRRAFNVTGAGAADERWDDPGHVVAPTPEPSPVMADAATHVAIRAAIKELDPDALANLQKWWGEVHMPPISKADRLSEAEANAVLAALEDLEAEPEQAETEDAPDDTKYENVAYTDLQRRYEALMPKSRKRAYVLARDALLPIVTAAVDPAEQASWSKLLDAVEAEAQAEHPAFPEAEG